MFRRFDGSCLFGVVMMLVAAVAASGAAAANAPPVATSSAQREIVSRRETLTTQQVDELLVAAEAQARSPDPVIAGIGASNIATVRKIQQAIERTASAEDELHALSDRVTETRRTMAADQERVRYSSTGAGPVTALLARHRGQLPTERELQASVTAAQARTSAAEVARIDLADELASLRDPRVVAERLRKGATGDLPLDDVVRAVEDRERRYLIPLLDAEGQYSLVLADIERKQTEYATLAAEYRAFIQAQLVWLPSDSAIGFTEGARTWDDAGLLLSRGFWQEIMHGVRVSLRQFPERWGGGAILVLGLLAYRPFLVRRLKALGEQVGTPTDRFTNTLKACLWTGLLALPVPVAVLVCGSLLATVSELSDPVVAFSYALRSVVSLVFMVALLREVTRPGGLAMAHFGWSAVSVQAIRAGVLLVGNLVVPLLFVSILALRANADTAASGVGRLVLIALFIVLAAVSVRVFRPTRGIFTTLMEQRPKGVVASTRGLWFPALVALPILLAIGACVGYVVTALILLRHTVDTYWVIVAIAIGLSVLERLFQSTNDRFAWRRGLDTDEHKRHAEQVGRVVRLTTTVLFLVGLSVAWRDVIPTLDFLNSNALWSVGGSEGTPVKHVTLRDLLVFGVVVVLTVQLVRDLPGVLGLALLQRFPLDASARYAIVALGRYVLVLAGIFAGFAALKIGWSNVQWLAAAVTVGLGFGLQEIFANFVSGLIMLAERPVRIGDIVTVDTVTGRVVNIATRATTLVDADEREHIIPNKQFITSRITNWTLNDTPVRYALDVGVEYGADLKRAHELLEKALAEQSLILADPAPSVILRGFGASSIDFSAFYYVAHPRDNFPVRNVLIPRVDALFREHGIGIAFPQLDVRIRK